MASKVFPARWDGECSECMGDVPRGDSARFNDDGDFIGQDCCGWEYDEEDED
jgi:hypothetical protein